MRFLSQLISSIFVRQNSKSVANYLVHILLSLMSIHPTSWNISFSRHGPCVQEWYEVMTSKDATMVRKGNKTNLFAVMLNLGSTDVEVREDVTLVNFNGLISSVGGSLGLFLGFSFYQFLLSVMYFLMSRAG